MRRHLKRVAHGAIWVGTGFADQGGLVGFVRRNGVWAIERVLHRSDGLPGERIRCIFEDRDGTLWLGSELDGLARFRDGHLLRVLTVKDGMPNNEAASMLQTPTGHSGWELRPGWCGLAPRRWRISECNCCLGREPGENPQFAPIVSHSLARYNRGA